MSEGNINPVGNNGGQQGGHGGQQERRQPKEKIAALPISSSVRDVFIHQEAQLDKGTNYLKDPRLKKLANKQSCKVNKSS